MSRTLVVPLSRDPEELVRQVGEQARATGAVFTGDARSGRFAALGVEGSYAVSGAEVSVTVTRKPAFAPWGLVEAELRKFFS